MPSRYPALSNAVIHALVRPPYLNFSGSGGVSSVFCRRVPREGAFRLLRVRIFGGFSGEFRMFLFPGRGLGLFPDITLHLRQAKPSSQLNVSSVHT